MEEFKALFWSVIGGFIVLAIAKIYRSYKMKSIKNDIDLIEFEMSHLEAMKKSSVEMNRSSFKGIFFILFLISLSNVIPHAFSFLIGGDFSNASSFIAFSLWVLTSAVALKLWKRYDNIKNFKDACTRLEAKKQKLEMKLKNS